METQQKFNPIIEQLSRIDKMASEESAKAAEKKEALIDEFEAKKAKTDAALKEDMKKRLDELKAQLDEETKEKIAAVRSEYEGRMKSLDDQYEANSDEWARQIFDAVIEG